jgi:ribonuclease HI
MDDKDTEWKLFFDGSCSKNQGAGAGVVLEDPEGIRNRYHKELGGNLTCNQAEVCCADYRVRNC